MFHIGYVTTNLVNGKKYLGIHSTENLDDGYIGSGKVLWEHAIPKHGIQNFHFEILHSADSREELLEWEKKSITPEMVKSSDFYNLMGGGEGGATMTGRKRPESFKKLISMKMKGNRHSEGVWKGRKHSEESKKKISESRKGRPLPEKTRLKMSETRKGMTHSEETKKKMRDSRLRHLAMKKNERQGES